MRAELTLSQEFVDQIADRVVEKLRPMLSANVKSIDDEIFSVETLSQYLHVDTSWVYKKVSLKEIPFFKAGKYTRFRKSVIDKWINKESVQPIPYK